MLQSGDPAPSFTLPDADMETFELSELKGKHHLVLYFYPRDNTPMCLRQAAEFSDHEDDFLRHGCLIVGVSPDDCLTHASFRDENGLSIRLLSDQDTEVCRQYDVWRAREVDGHTRMGVLRSTFIIDRDGVIRHALYDVSPRGHAAAVFELVKELESGHGNGNSQKHRRNA